MKTLINFLICVFFLLTYETTFSQVNNIKDTVISKPILYLMADELPIFKGGKNKLQEYLNENLKWPDQIDVNGTVLVSFIVRSDGSINDIKIEKNLQIDCDKEALRVIKLMPKWKPGKLHGKSVDIIMYFPIRFILH